MKLISIQKLTSESFLKITTLLPVLCNVESWLFLMPQTNGCGWLKKAPQPIREASVNGEKTVLLKEWWVLLQKWTIGPPLKMIPEPKTQEMGYPETEAISNVPRYHWNDFTCRSPNGIVFSIKTMLSKWPELPWR